MAADRQDGAASSTRRSSSAGLDTTEGVFATIRQGAVASPPAGTPAEQRALEGWCPCQSVPPSRASRHTWARSERVPQSSDGVRSSDGVGILLAGGRHIVIRDNSVRDNHPTGAIDPKRVGFAGGIVVVSSEHLSPFAGLTGSKPFDNTIADKSLRGNQPVDLVYDKSARAIASCRTSVACRCPRACATMTRRLPLQARGR